MAETAKKARERIVRAAAELLTRGGREAVSTRAVSAKAGVQAPAIYRQFSDMRELLHAAAREVMAVYVREKAARVASDDPVEDLRRGWDLHLAFGLANPAAYTLLYGASEADVDNGVAEGLSVLEALVARIAQAGRLRVSVAQAVRLIHAGGMGATLSLLATPAAERDLRLSADMREAVLSAILVGSSAKKSRGAGSIAARAVSLQAVLADAGEIFSAGEQQLLSEWLERIARISGR